MILVAITFVLVLILTDSAEVVASKVSGAVICSLFLL